MPPLDPTTIDENADVVAIRQNGLDESLDLVSKSEVRRVDRSFPPERANLIPCGGVAVVALYEHYIGSGFGQRYCHGLANAPCRACDQRDSAV
jgi:hypothetical protein